MSSQLILSLIIIALVDSLNPSAIIMTLTLLSSKKALLNSSLYIIAIALTYFSIGLVFYFGFSQIISQINFNFGQPTIWEYLAQLLVGIGLVWVGVRWQINHKKEDQGTENREFITPWGSFLLGVGITFTESTTAAPYFAALTTISRSIDSIFDSITILAIYNLIFILPPVALVVIYLTNKAKAEPILRLVRLKIQSWSQLILKYGLAIIGSILILDFIGFTVGMPLF